jgi:hypothetical protein
MPTFRISGFIPLLPLYAFMAWTGTNFSYMKNKTSVSERDGLSATGYKSPIKSDRIRPTSRGFAMVYVPRLLPSPRHLGRDGSALRIVLVFPFLTSDK